jgi:hypothetical protein
MALEIPKEDAGSITAIKALPPTTLEKFIAALAEAPVISNPRAMAEHVAKKIPSVPADKLVSLIETLYAMYQIRELSGVSHARFLTDLTEAILKHPELRIPPKELPKLRSLLERLLDIGTLNTIAKAARLQRDGERLYCSSKVLSDIRPVFGSDPSERPRGAVLTHTLKIGYHEGSGHTEFHVVLDSTDLGELANVIRRAELKDKTLRGLLKTIELTSLDD